MEVISDPPNGTEEEKSPCAGILADEAQRESDTHEACGVDAFYVLTDPPIKWACEEIVEVPHPDPRKALSKWRRERERVAAEAVAWARAGMKRDIDPLRRWELAELVERIREACPSCMGAVTFDDED